MIRSLNRAEKLRLSSRKQSRVYVLSLEEVASKVKKSKKDSKPVIHGQLVSTTKNRKERRTRVKVLNSTRDRKKELEVRIARQRERGRLRTENKRTRKEKLREALMEKRKAS